MLELELHGASPGQAFQKALHPGEEAVGRGLGGQGHVEAPVAEFCLEEVVGVEGGLRLPHAHGGLHQEEDRATRPFQEGRDTLLQGVGLWDVGEKLPELPPLGLREGGPAQAVQGLPGEL